MEGASVTRAGIDREEILSRARALVPFLAEKAQETERHRSILPEIHDRLMEAGLFHIMMAPRLGGRSFPVSSWGRRSLPNMSRAGSA